MENALNEAESKALQELKTRVFDENTDDSGKVFSDADIEGFRARFYNDDTTLNRFLTARKYEVPRAVDMFRKYLQWRIDIKLDELVPERDFPNQLKTRIAKFGGRDKQGRPSIVIVPRNNTPGTYSIDELEKALAYALEICVARLEPPNDKVIIMFDYKDWGIRNVDSALDRRLMQVTQDYFPELLAECYLLNPPWYFRGVWAVLKPFVDSKTYSKIHMWGSDFKQKLSELFNKEELLEEYGGSFKALSLEEYILKYKDVLEPLRTKKTTESAQQKPTVDSSSG